MSFESPKLDKQQPKFISLRPLVSYWLNSDIT